MGRKKHIFEDEEPEREAGRESDPTGGLEEIHLESFDSASGGEEDSPARGGYGMGRKAGPRPLGFGTVILIFLGMSVLSSVIAVMLWVWAG